jgi:hypothetical protein
VTDEMVVLFLCINSIIKKLTFWLQSMGRTYKKSQKYRILFAKNWSLVLKRYISYPEITSWKEPCQKRVMGKRKLRMKITPQKNRYNFYI